MSGVKNSKAIILILLGTLVWSLVMVKSGWIYDFGMGFWGANGHDGIWHLSLINSLARGTWEMPVFAGENIKNYHLGFDLLLAAIVRFTQIPAQTLYFQILPPLLALGVGWSVYQLTRNLWSVFFVYFGGSWGWLISFLRNGTLGGESMFWSQQAISTLINPPFALSLIFLFWGLKIISKEKLNIPLAIVIFGLLPSIKIYAGIIGFVGLTILGIKNKKIWLIEIIAGIIAGVLYWPFNHSSSQLLVFAPGWFLQTLVNLSDRFYWPRLYMAMVSGNLFKQIISYILGFGIFVLGNFGTRILFILNWKNWNLFLLSGILVGIIFPMLFLQAGTPWNTIQFFYYTQVFAGILAGIAVANLKLSKLFYLLIISLTIPTTYDSLSHYLPARPPAMISKQELEALAFLKKQSPGVVLVPVFDKQAAADAVSNPPRPLYLYESSGYVSAFSQKSVYLEDEVNLDITSYPWRIRRQEVEQFFAQKDISLAKEFLLDNKIEYLYLPNVAKMRPILNDSQLSMTKIFENSQVSIWERN